MKMLNALERIYYRKAGQSPESAWWNIEILKRDGHLDGFVTRAELKPCSLNSDTVTVDDSFRKQPMEYQMISLGLIAELIQIMFIKYRHCWEWYHGHSNVQHPDTPKLPSVRAKSAEPTTGLHIFNVKEQGTGRTND